MAVVSIVLIVLSQFTADAFQPAVMRRLQQARIPVIPATRVADAELAQIVRRETEDLLETFRDVKDPGALSERVRQCGRALTAAATEGSIELTREMQKEFRERTSHLVKDCSFITHARTWPAGYAGDYRILDDMYTYLHRKEIDPENTPMDFWTSYIQSCTLVRAVRCRMRRLRELLTARVETEPTEGNWLNVACGPCRELLDVPARKNTTAKIYCLDQDPASLTYAMELLGRGDCPNAASVEFVEGNALRLVDPKKTHTTYGPLTTIYSAGLFDYLSTSSVTKLIHGLYDALAPGGLLIMPFKDKDRYDTFDYHWLMEWHFFLQRSQAEFAQIIQNAGIPDDKWTVERDESGVILFFIAHK